MLTRRKALRVGAQAAAGLALLPLGHRRAEASILVNDIHSKLNATQVDRVLSCSANGICAICSIPTKNTTTRLVRTYRCTRTRRSLVPSRLSDARWRCQFWAACTTNISERVSDRDKACDLHGGRKRAPTSTVTLPVPRAPSGCVRQQRHRQAHRSRHRSTRRMGGLLRHVGSVRTY
jgi:hypothetical protein